MPSLQSFCNTRFYRSSAFNPTYDTWYQVSFVSGLYSNVGRKRGVLAFPLVLLHPEQASYLSVFSAVTCCLSDVYVPHVPMVTKAAECTTSDVPSGRRLPRTSRGHRTVTSGRQSWQNNNRIEKCFRPPLQSCLFSAF